MPNINQFIAAGIDRCDLGFWGTDGYPTGGNVTRTDGATTSNQLRRLLGIQSAPLAIAENEGVNVTGDNRSQGKIDLGAETIPEFVANFGVFDLDMQARTQNTSVMTLGDTRIGVLMPVDPVYPDAFLILQSNIKRKDAGFDGNKAWGGYIVHKCTLQPLGPDNLEYRAAHTDRYKITPTFADRFPFGITITDALVGTSGAVYSPFAADNKVMIDVFEGTGAVLSFTLRYTPVAASAAKVVVYVNGVAQAYTTNYTVVTATKTLTFVVAPADGAVVTVWYEWNAE